MKERRSWMAAAWLGAAATGACSAAIEPDGVDGALVGDYGDVRLTSAGAPTGITTVIEDVRTGQAVGSVQWSVEDLSLRWSFRGREGHGEVPVVPTLADANEIAHTLWRQHRGPPPVVEDGAAYVSCTPTRYCDGFTLPGFECVACLHQYADCTSQTVIRCASVGS